MQTFKNYVEFYPLILERNIFLKKDKLIKEHYSKWSDRGYEFVKGLIRQSDRSPGKLLQVCYPCHQSQQLTQIELLSTTDPRQVSVSVTTCQGQRLLTRVTSAATSPCGITVNCVTFHRHPQFAYSHACASTQTLKHTLAPLSQLLWRPRDEVGADGID